MGSKWTNDLDKTICLLVNTHIGRQKTMCAICTNGVEKLCVWVEHML